MTKIIFFLPLVVSFSRNWHLKMSKFVKKNIFPDGRTKLGTEGQIFLNLNLYTYDPCQFFVSQTLN